MTSNGNDLVITQTFLPTRMHSSRMRTGRTLTVFRWRPSPPKNWRPPRKIGDPQKFGDPPKNWTPPEKLETPGTRPPRDQTPPLWTEWMTDACENITLAKTSFRPVTTQYRQIHPKENRSAKISQVLISNITLLYNMHKALIIIKHINCLLQMI